MLNFKYYSPTKLYFGKGEENNVGKYLKENGATRVMILHYGTGLPHEVMLLDKVKNSIDSEGLYFMTFDDIRPNPVISRCFECVEKIKEEEIDFLLAVGGGSVIDTAKFAAVQALYDGNLWEDCFLRRDLPVPKKSIPVASVLTLCASGSEASEACLIRDEKNDLKLGIDNDVMRPVFAVMNPELTYTLPQYQTACGVADILCHLHESYWTHDEDGMFMNEYIEAMMRTVIYYAEIAIREPENYLARAQIMLIGTMANWHLTWCGRTDDGAVHFIQEPIAAKYNSAHGHCCAVITLGWLRYACHETRERFVRYFNRVWNIPADELHADEVIKKGIEKQRAFYHMMGLDTTLESIGVRKGDERWLAEHADKKPHGKTGNWIRMDADMIIDLYKLCDHR